VLPDNNPITVGQSGYVYNGQKWFGTSPNVSYKVNATADRNTAVQNAANTWSNAGANFAFSYGGTHSRSGCESFNEVNEVMWYDLEACQNYEEGEIARAVWWYYMSTGEIVEADMIFNTHFAWSTATPTPEGQYDVETVALHEFGHWLSLGHSSVYDSIMWWQYKGTQRTLATDDKNGIKYIYGSSAGTKPPAPTLSSPAEGATVAGTSIDFQWDAAANATKYQLQVRRSSDNTLFKNEVLGNVTSSSQTGFPNDGTVFKWRVRAGNAAGWGPWSGYRNFTNGSVVVTKPTVRPTLTSPAEGATVAGTSVTFQWDAAAGATKYKLAVRKSSDNTLFKNKTLGNVTSSSQAGFPNDGTVFKWRVRAGNAAGWGPWSGYRNFTNGP
jgi:hypothetical protein